MVTPSYTRTAPHRGAVLLFVGVRRPAVERSGTNALGVRRPRRPVAHGSLPYIVGADDSVRPYKLLKLCTSPPHSHVSAKSTHRLLNKRIIAMMTATERIEKTGSKNVVVIYISQLTVISLSLPVTVPLSQHVADIMPRYASSLNVSFP